MNQPTNPQVVQLGPLPMTWQIATTFVNGKGVVVLRIFTPQGLSVFFIDPDQANVIGAAINREGHAARTGLQIVKSIEGVA